MTEESPTNARPKVLVVDDEPRLREILSFYLEDAGFEVVTAASGNDAKVILTDDNFDVVVSDVRMPNGTGIELLDWIKARRPERPVVLFVTAHSDITEEDAYAKGAEVLLSKPVKSSALVAAVKSALASRDSWSRRKDIRIDTMGTAKVAKKGSDLTVEAKVCNVGRGGAYIKTDGAQLPKVGDELQVTIQVLKPMILRFEALGVVRWVRAEKLPGYGVQFVNLTDDQVSLLAAFVESHNLKSFIPNS